MSPYPPVAELMPHSGPMVLLDALHDWSPGQATARLRVRCSDPFVVDRRLAVPLLLEHMAQTVAVCLGYQAFLGGEGMRLGMLIACRSFVAHRPHVQVGQTLALHVRRQRGHDSLSHFDAQVIDISDALASADVASASLTLFHPETLDASTQAMAQLQSDTFAVGGR